MSPAVGETAAARTTRAVAVGPQMAAKDELGGTQQLSWVEASKLLSCQMSHTLEPGPGLPGFGSRP